MRAVPLLLLAPLATLADNSTCWYKDDSINNGLNSDSFPCAHNTAMCCPEGFFCYNNGLCRRPAQTNKEKDYWARFSCIDKSWKNPNCPQNCINSTPGGSEAVMDCGNGVWCCNWRGHDFPDGKDCCESSDHEERSFNFGAGKPFAIINGGKARDVSSDSDAVQSNSQDGQTQTTPRGATASETTIKGSAQANTRSSRLADSTLSIRTTDSKGSVATVVVVDSSQPAPGFSPSTTASALADDASASGTSTSKIVGIAVGVPVAIAAVCILGWLLWARRRQRVRDQHQATPLDFSPDAHEKPHSTFTGGYAGLINDEKVAKPPSEIDSREIRVPINPVDTAHMTTLGAGGNVARDQTTNTLYPNAQPTYPNHANPISPSLPTGTSQSSVFSHPSQDYSEWAVTPRLHQQRWSGSTAQDGATSSFYGAETGNDGRRSGEGNGPPPAELMGRPQIPPTIHVLP